MTSTIPETDLVTVMESNPTLLRESENFPLPLFPSIVVHSYIVKVEKDGTFTYNGQQNLRIEVESGQAILRFLLDVDGADFVSTPVLWFDEASDLPIRTPEPLAVQRTKKLVTLCDFNFQATEEQTFAFRVTIALPNGRILTSPDPTIVNRIPSGELPLSS